MGLFGGLFGGGPDTYNPEHTGEYENAARAGIFRRAKVNTNQRGLGFQDVGAPVYAKEATSDYDFSPIKQAVEGYKKGPTLFKESYNPSTFSFSRLPEQYGNQEYELGAKNLRRDAAGNLQKTQEASGTRRPGLLLKSQNTNQRQLGENLSALASNIGLEKMRQNVEQSRAEQTAQADENYRGYQSRSSLERANEENRLKNLSGLFDAGRGQIGLESDITQREREYRDKALEYLMDMFAKSASIQNQSAQIGQSARGGTLGFLGGLAGKAASAYAGGV